MNNFLRAPFFDHRTFVDNISTVTNCKGFPYVVVRYEDADSLILQLVNDFLDIYHSQRINTGKGFIQKHIIRGSG